MADSSDRSFAHHLPETEHPRFPHLFSPLPIGPTIAKNRIVCGAHATGFVGDGLYTEQMVAYHRERALGGAAIIISPGTVVAPNYGTLQNVDDRIVPWYQKVVEALHPCGAKYFAELSHPGRQGSFTGPGAEIFYAPSAVPGQRYGFELRVPHELDTAKIREIICAFGAAARRCREGGLDGIELHFAHGNLAQQFMSPVTNQRCDEWGGSVENRLRFAREVLYAVREAVGREIVVGCRLSGSELEQGGLTRLDMMEIAGLLDGLGMLDYFSITMGHYSDWLNTVRNIPDMSFPPAVWGSSAAGIKHIVRVPVFVVGRVNHPALAEQLLTQRQCDMVVLVRALIADPYLPAKAYSGHVEDIRQCVGAQEGCWWRFERGRGISCIQNPVVGREREWGGALPRTSRNRRVVVIGGGPAGLECARVAAERGHSVLLLEREKAPGGQVRIAAQAPQREELGQIVEWLRRQCMQAGAEVRLATEGTPESVLMLSPEVVVVATGALPLAWQAPTEDGVPVVDAWSVLEGQATIGRRVLVVDETGKRPGLSVAHYLAMRGHNVEFVTPTVYPGQFTEPTGWRVTYQRLLELGVKFRELSTVAKVSGGQVTVRHVYTNAQETIDGIETVVTATLPRALDSLYHALQGKVEEVHLAGDAMAPRGIEEAIYDGYRIGREL